jgi:hypothetical protein
MAWPRSPCVRASSGSWDEMSQGIWTILNKQVYTYNNIWYSITRYNKYMWWKLCSCFESADTAKSAMLPPWPCQVKTTQERIDGRSSPLWSGRRCGWCKVKHHISSHSKYVIWWKVCTCKLDILQSLYHYTMSSGDPFGGRWHAVTCYPCESIWGTVWYLLAALEGSPSTAVKSQEVEGFAEIQNWRPWRPEKTRENLLGEAAAAAPCLSAPRPR